jgi:hypothetical protein
VTNKKKLFTLFTKKSEFSLILLRFLHHEKSYRERRNWMFIYVLFIQGDSSFTAGGKIDLKNYDFTFIFCRPNLLSIRHIISKNEIYKLIRSNFAIFSIINCLIYSTL